MSEIGQMTLHDVRRLAEYSKTHPSTRWLAAACAAALGVELPKPQTAEKPKPMHIEQARAWAAAANRLVNPNG